MSCPWIYSGSMEQLRLKPIVLCVHAQLLQSCLTLCDPMDCSPPDSSVHGILQTTILEWVAIPSSRGSSQPRDRTRISCIFCVPRQILYPLSYLGSSINWVQSFLSGCFRSFVPYSSRCGGKEREGWEGLPDSRCGTEGPLVDLVLDYWGNHVPFYTFLNILCILSQLRTTI